MKILLLDDDKNITFILTTLLKFKNYDVESLNEPNLVWEKLDEVKYDLLVMDYMMEGMNGLEVAEKIRASDKPYKNMKIFFLTAKNLNEEEVQKSTELDLKYERKPINPESFHNSILELLEG